MNYWQGILSCDLKDLARCDSGCSIIWGIKIIKTFIYNMLIFIFSDLAKKWRHSALMMALALSISAFTPQPTAERKAQEKLPQSKDEIWTALGKCALTLDPATATYRIAFTPEIKAMEGKEVTVGGFMLPLESKPSFTHYLLSKRTPTCPFCPPGLPNEIVEVFSSKAVTWDSDIVVVSGTLALSSDPEKGLFFQMKNGQKQDLKPYEMPRMLPVN